MNWIEEAQRLVTYRYELEAAIDELEKGRFNTITLHGHSKAGLLIDEQELVERFTVQALDYMMERLKNTQFLLGLADEALSRALSGPKHPQEEVPYEDPEPFWSGSEPNDLQVTLIVCTDASGGIGLNGQMPWGDKPKDPKWFREQTMGKVVVMGYNTWRSIADKPLEGRTNVVLSRRPHVNLACTYCKTVEEVLRRYGDQEIMVIGGAATYNAFMPYASKILLTRLNDSYNADTFFKIDGREWKLMESVIDNDMTFSTFYRR